MTASPQPAKLVPFLMFQNGEAHEAMTFYTQLFDDGEILSVERFGPGEPGEGTVRQGLFRVAGQQMFASPEVAAGTAKFTQELDIPALQAKLGLQPRPEPESKTKPEPAR